MSKTVVISQPMFLPWVGMFEQLNLCDVYVYYDDVQFPQGRSFINRIQIKTKEGMKWLSVPIDKKNSGKLINETLISYNQNWRENHISTIKHVFAKSKYKNDVFYLVEQIYSKKFETISELDMFSFELLAKYFNFEKEFLISSKMNIGGSSSERLLNITQELNGNRYITGLGALKYINYDLFENNNISLEYMDYKNNAYNQLFAEFTPYVTILDLIANVGIVGIKYINSKSTYWKDFKYE